MKQKIHYKDIVMSDRDRVFFGTNASAPATGAPVIRSHFPWRVSTNDPAAVLDASGHLLLTCQHSSYYAPSAVKQRAEYVCRAVNSHADLLAACRAFVAACEDAVRIYGDQMPATAGMVSAAVAARAAIDRAEG